MPLGRAEYCTLYTALRQKFESTVGIGVFCKHESQNINKLLVKSQERIQNLFYPNGHRRSQDLT